MKPLLVAFIAMALTVVAEAGTELKLLKGNVKLQSSPQIFNLQQSDVVQDFVVQFKQVIRSQDRAALTQSSLKIRRYLPEDAYIVTGSQSDIEKFARSNDGVRAYGLYQADWKLSDQLPAVSLFSLGKKAIVLVTAFTESERANLEIAISNIDPTAVVLNNDDRYLTISVELNKLSKIANLRGIEFIQQVERMKPMNMTFEEDGAQVFADQPADYGSLKGDETGTQVMKFQSVWAQGFHGEGEIVSMADTGLDSGNASAIAEDFAGAIPSGYAFGAGAKDWSDPMGHGTHVAGSVMGTGKISEGRIQGGAYAAKMIPQGMWSPILDNLSVPPQLSKLFETAYKDGARVHTNSWGAAANFGAYESMAQKVDEFMWKNPEMLILFAAGNSGVDKDKDGKIDNNSMSSPGTAKNCLTVGASENVTTTGGIQVPISKLRVAKENWPAEPIFSSFLSDKAEGVAMFSSRGPTRDGRIKPDVVAPGTNILSNRSHVKDSSPLWGGFGDHYAWSGGTSMATPLTAGAAAVVRQMLKSKLNMSQPSGALVKAMLMHTAIDMFPGQYGQGSATQELQHRPNNDEGYGRVDMNAVANIGSSTKFVDEKDGVAQGDKKVYTVKLSKTGKLLVNMVYTDAPGSPSAAKALVNNIDLVLVSSDGKEVGSNDSTNNNEVIEATDLPAGEYKIEVRGANIPMGNNGKQPFALIYSTL